MLDRVANVPRVETGLCDMAFLFFVPYYDVLAPLIGMTWNFHLFQHSFSPTEALMFFEPSRLKFVTKCARYDASSLHPSTAIQNMMATVNLVCSKTAFHSETLFKYSMHPTPSPTSEPPLPPPPASTPPQSLPPPPPPPPAPARAPSAPPPPARTDLQPATQKPS